MSAEERIDQADQGADAAEVVALLKSQGRKVVEASGCWWYNAYGQQRMLFAFPPQRQVNPNETEIREIFRQVPSAMVLRHLATATAASANSYLWVVRRPYSIESLSANHRSKVRRGLRQCEVRPLTFNELDECGRHAQSDTMRRLGKSESSFGISEGMRRSRAYRAWGAFVGSELAAFAITLTVEGWVHIQVNRSTTSLLKHYPNNALIFRIIEESLAGEGVEAVSYGWESLTRNESLEQFKSGMGFTREPVEQRIVIAPRLRPLWNPVSRPLRWLLGLLIAARPGNPRLQQIAGICRFIDSRRVAASVSASVPD